MEVIGESGMIKLPLCPTYKVHSMLINKSEELIVLGEYAGNDKRCYKLENGQWLNQSPLTQERQYSVCISMDNGIYCFGGSLSSRTSEFLPNGQCKWHEISTIPELEISRGDGVAISPTKLIVVGGEKNEEGILEFNISNQQWTRVGILHQGRKDHRCFLFNGNIVVTGGRGSLFLNSTEIIKFSKDGIITTTAGYLNVPRLYHGMGIVTINEESRLIVFGGLTPYGRTDSIEEWDDITETWKISSLKLSQPRAKFGYCQLPSSYTKKYQN